MIITNDTVSPHKELQTSSHFRISNGSPASMAVGTQKTKTASLGDSPRFSPPSVYRPFSEISIVAETNTVNHNKTKSPGPSAAWMMDGQFVKSKIFRARLERAAIAIQKNARRFLERDRIQTEKESAAKAVQLAMQHRAAVKVQSVARGAKQRMALKRQNAACRIQAGVRGRKIRKKRQIFDLEKRLADIKLSHKSELESIEAWKMKQMERLDRSRIREVTKKQEVQKQVGKELNKIENDFLSLRKENRQLRAQNERLERMCIELREENDKLEHNLSAINSGIARLTSFVNTTEKQIPRSCEIAGLFEERVNRAQKAAEKWAACSVF